MTKEQYTRLLKYEQQLFTAKVGNYVRKMYSSTINELDEIYADIFKTQSKFKTGCGKCILMDTKRLAEEFYKYKEKLESKQQEQIEDNNKPKSKSKKNGK